MVATDEELIEAFYIGARGALATPGFRAIYNLGRQHSAQSRQEDLLTQPAPLSSSIEAGIDRFGEWLAREMPPGTVIGDPLNWAPRIALAVLNACQEVEPTPPPAPAGGLVEMVAEEICDFTGDHVDDNEASAVIHAVADWLDARGDRGSAAVLRREADRSAALSPAQPASLTAPAGGLLEEMARLLANRISTMRPSADCTPLACAVLCVVADAAEKMVPGPNLTWERVAIWLDMESKLEGRADG
jgi:hypothetical protein